MRRPRGRPSLTLRLTLLFAVASSAVLAVLGLLLSKSLDAHFEALDVEALEGKLEMVSHGLAAVRTTDDLAHLPLRLEGALVGHHGLAVVIADPRGKALFSNGGTRFPPELLEPSANRRIAGPVEWPQGGSVYRGIAASLSTEIPDHPTLRVGIATDTAHHREYIDGVLRTVWAFVGGAALLSGLFGWVAARRGLAPLRAMRDQASAITAHRLDRRLPVESAPAELAELAHELNAMLERLEDAFKRLSDFSSDLAHELRTPISNLMMQTQVALARERDAEHYRSILESNAEEFERLARMVSDMLFLAKAEHGLAMPHRAPLDLAQEIRNLFDYYDALADQRGIVLELDGAGTVAGDKLMIRRALSNLLSNAIRHSRDGGTVRLDVREAPDATTVTVANEGDEIPAEHLERIFDRFHRLDASRKRAGEGAGLGLAITKSIVVAHGGSVTARSDEGRTVFTLRLPRAPAGGAG